MRAQPAQQIIEAPWAVQGQRQLAAAERERLQHPGQAEEVVGVEVRQEHLVELDQADVRAQELPLRALAAVEEQLLAAAPDERGGRSAAAVGIEPAVPRKTTSRSTPPV